MRNLKLVVSWILPVYISLFHHKHGSTNNKQYIIKRINTTHTHKKINVYRYKVKVHTLDIAPLRSESPPQKRSGMARVLKGFHISDFTT